ncbi:MAG TPA: GNAT family N-acetyltransferase [Candidatus Eisenbacteria bacterium]
MSDLTIRAAMTTDVPAIAAFIVRMNAVSDQRCLHCGDSIADVMKSLSTLGLPPERSFYLAFMGERIVGLIGADLATDIGRGWLWGPYADVAEPATVASALAARFLDDLPDGIAVVDSFLDTNNRFTGLLADAHGFEAPRIVHFYRAPRPTGATPAGAPMADDLKTDVADTHLPLLNALHEASFPGTWRSVDQMRASDGNSAVLYVAEEGGVFQGYVYSEAAPEEETGHVHYLAVMPEWRGRGVGRRLLDAALAWCFVARDLPSASLTVFDTLTDARSLYESAGFRLLESGVTRRWTRPGA